MVVGPDKHHLLNIHCFLTREAMKVAGNVAEKSANLAGCQLLYATLFIEANGMREEKISYWYGLCHT